MRPFAPLIAGQAVADATTSLRMTQTVLAQDFREPVVLAKELATLDVLSEGRLQVGLGAGWLRQEYEDAGMTFASAPVRIARLEETAVILKGLFADGPFSFDGEHFQVHAVDGLPKPIQQPGPPIMIGGGGKEGAVRRGTASRHRPADAEQPQGQVGHLTLAVLRSSHRGEDRLDPRRRGHADSSRSSSARSCSPAPSPTRPEEHLTDFAERVAIVTERMGGARVDFEDRRPASIADRRRRPPR